MCVLSLNEDSILENATNRLHYWALWCVEQIVAEFYNALAGGIALESMHPRLKIKLENEKKAGLEKAENGALRNLEITSKIWDQ